MTRSTERLVYLTLLFLLVGFLVYDWYERIYLPKHSPTEGAGSALAEEADPVLEGPLTSVPPKVSSIPEDVGEGQLQTTPIDWPLEGNEAWDLPPAPESSIGSRVSEPPISQPPSGEQLSSRQIDEFYDNLARKKSKGPTHPILVDWERTGGEKPDWMVMEEWRNRLRLENYLNPGPVYTSTYTDVYGNRHRSFEDRSGRIDVFNTWGGESIYLNPK